MKRIIPFLFVLLTTASYGQSWSMALLEKVAIQKTLDSTKAVLADLQTDKYVTMAGNYTTVLGPGIKQTVFNTALTPNQYEVWVGTAAGNRLLTVRTIQLSTVATSGQTVFTIAHSLPYQPPLGHCWVTTPAGTGNPVVVTNSTSAAVTFASGVLLNTPISFTCFVR